MFSFYLLDKNGKRGYTIREDFYAVMEAQYKECKDKSFTFEGIRYGFKNFTDDDVEVFVL